MSVDQRTRDKRTRDLFVAFFMPHRSRWRIKSYGIPVWGVALGSFFRDSIAKRPLWLDSDSAIGNRDNDSEASLIRQEFHSENEEPFQS